MCFLSASTNGRQMDNGKSKKNRLHCFPALNLQERHNEKIGSTDNPRRWHKRRGEDELSSPVYSFCFFCFSCSSSQGIPYNCSRLHSSSDLLSHPSTTGHSKARSIRESKEWAGEKVTKAASSVLHLLAICAWPVHTLGLTLPPHLFISSSGLCLELSSASSPLVVTRSQIWKGEEENKVGSSAPVHFP